MKKIKFFGFDMDYTLAGRSHDLYFGSFDSFVITMTISQSRH